MNKEKSFFSRQLKKIMAENNMNQLDVKNKTGIAQTVISRWVRDEAVPAFASVQKLAKAFNVPLSYFLENYEEENDKNSEILKMGEKILKELAEIKQVLNSSKQKS